MLAKYRSNSRHGLCKSNPVYTCSKLRQQHTGNKITFKLKTGNTRAASSQALRAQEEPRTGARPPIEL